MFKQAWNQAEHARPREEAAQQRHHAGASEGAPCKPAPSTEGGKTINDHAADVPDGAIIHVVVDGDTFARLSLRYGVTESAIKRSNPELFSDSQLSFPPLIKEVYIPPSGRDNGLPKEPPLTTFIRQTSADRETAQFYLDDAGGDVVAAVRQYKLDDGWEESIAAAAVGSGKLEDVELREMQPEATAAAASTNSHVTPEESLEAEEMREDKKTV